MKTRSEVVGHPEIVTKRRELQASYARLDEARRRAWGKGSGDRTYPTSPTADEVTAAKSEHARLELEYEADVAAAMAR